MAIFTQHTSATAPEGSSEVLAKVQERYGFIPNLAAYAAESPLVLGCVLDLVKAFDRATLTPQEQQIVLLTASTMNGCDYCRTVHTALGRGAQVDMETLEAVISMSPLPNPKLNALRNFTAKLMEEKGWLSEQDVEDFLAAGYSRAQVLEVVLGIAMKTLTNYTNHLVNAEPNAEFIAMAQGRAAA